MKVKECKWCKRKFTLEVSKGASKYCSVECANEARKEEKREYNKKQKEEGGVIPKGPIVKEAYCKNCGKKMLLTRSQTNKQYCSVECRKSYTKKNVTERDSLGYFKDTKRKIKYKDPDTGAIFYEDSDKLDILATEAKRAGTTYGKLTCKDYLPTVEPSEAFLSKEHKEKEYTGFKFRWEETKKK